MAESKTDLMKEWLNDASEEALQAFIIKLGNEDDILYRRIRRQFGNSSNNDQLTQLRIELGDTIAENMRSGFIYHQQTIDICDIFDNVIQNALNKQSRGQIGLSIQKILLIIELTVSHLEIMDGSSGRPSRTLGLAFESLSKLAKTAVSILPDPEKKMLVKDAIKVFNMNFFDRWGKFRFPIFESILPLVTTETFELINAAANRVFERYPAGGFFGPMIENDYIAFKIKGLISIGNFRDAEKLMNDHINSSKIREIAINFYLSQEDFRTAEKLATNGLLKRDNDQPIWLKYLEKIYAKTHDDRKLTRVYKDQLLMTKRGVNETDYQKLRALLQKQGRWDKESTELLQEFSEKLPPENYAAILSIKDQKDKLMVFVEEKPGLISAYGNILYDQYPDKVTKLYYETLVKVDIGSSRKHYRHIVTMINKYAEYGDKEKAKEWCQQIINQYPRRAALVDEIQQVLNKIEAQ